jgi:hypothetical protein
MLLLAPAGTRGALGFLAGRLAALIVATLAFAALSGLLDGGAGDEEERGWLRIGLGLALIAGAGLIWRKDRKAGASAEPAGWMRAIDRATPASALRLGAMLTLSTSRSWPSPSARG